MAAFDSCISDHTSQRARLGLIESMTMRVDGWAVSTASTNSLVVLQELLAPFSGARVVVALIDDDGPRGVLEDRLLDVMNQVRHLRAAEAAVEERHPTKTVSRVPAHDARAADEDRGVGGKAVLGIIRREIFNPLGMASDIGIGDLPREQGGACCEEERYEHAKT